MWKDSSATRKSIRPLFPYRSPYNGADVTGPARLVLHPIIVGRHGTVPACAPSRLRAPAPAGRLDARVPRGMRAEGFTACDTGPVPGTSAAAVAPAARLGGAPRLEPSLAAGDRGALATRTRPVLRGAGPAHGRLERARAVARQRRGALPAEPGHAGDARARTRRSSARRSPRRVSVGTSASRPASRPRRRRATACCGATCSSPATATRRSTTVTGAARRSSTRWRRRCGRRASRGSRDGWSATTTRSTTSGSGSGGSGTTSCSPTPHRSVRSRSTRTWWKSRSPRGPRSANRPPAAIRQGGSDLVLVTRVTTGAKDSEASVESRPSARAPRTGRLRHGAARRQGGRPQRRRRQPHALLRGRDEAGARRPRHRGERRTPWTSTTSGRRPARRHPRQPSRERRPPGRLAPRAPRRRRPAPATAAASRHRAPAVPAAVRCGAPADEGQSEPLRRDGHAGAEPRSRARRR